MYPTYPDVKLRNLPFYKIEAVLMKPCSLQPKGLARFQEQTSSFHLTPTQVIHANKVHIFWEGYKILRNLPLTFDCIYCSQKLAEDFAKFCGLLRIYELEISMKNSNLGLRGDGAWRMAKQPQNPPKQESKQPKC